MTRHNLLVLTLLTGLAACGDGSRVVWMQNGKTADEANRQFAQCDYEAERTVPSYLGLGSQASLGDTIAVGMSQGRIIKACMTANGYHTETIAGR